MNPPNNAEKEQLWQAYQDRRPTRVPVRLSHNPRIFLLDPQANREGYTFEAAAADPHTHVRQALEYQLYARTQIHRYSDQPTGLPDVWGIGLVVYNVYEAAILGAPVHFPPHQVPSTEPFLTDANKHAVFEQDIEHPGQNPFIRRHLEFWEQMQRICADLRFEGRPVCLHPWALCGTDGPVTVACNLRGTDFLMDLVEDPEYADRLMDFITRAAIVRRQFFRQFWGAQLGPYNGMADDSTAMLSEQMYRERILPYHRRFFEADDPSLPRSMHLCGNAGHLFPTVCRELGVTSVDTGFPVDHAQLRRALGADVEIAGGPGITLLQNGTPDQVYRRTQEVLLSGVKEGGRFVLTEANNLPPLTPPANLEAMYVACLEHGRY